MLYPKPCYNEPCYKEAEVYQFIKIFMDNKISVLDVYGAFIEYMYDFLYDQLKEAIQSIFCVTVAPKYTLRIHTRIASETLMRFQSVSTRYAMIMSLGLMTRQPMRVICLKILCYTVP